MSGQCVDGCGACCDPIVSWYGPFELAVAPAWETEMVWMRENTTPVARGAALKRWRAAVGAGDLVDAGGQRVEPFFYECHHYDPDARVCTNYENRPPMCRDFPWYGKTPSPAAAIPKTCGYLVDIGKEPVPVELTTKPETKP